VTVTPAVVGRQLAHPAFSLNAYLFVESILPSEAKAKEGRMTRSAEIIKTLKKRRFFLLSLSLSLSHFARAFFMA